MRLDPVATAPGSDFVATQYLADSPFQIVYLMATANPISCAIAS